MNKIDLLISIGCPQILSKKILLNLKLGAINVHGGYLPNYRGAYSVFWNLYDKSKYYGFSIHWMNEKIDKGSVIFRKKYKLNYQNTMFEVYEKLAPNMIKYLNKIISNNLNLKKKIKISKWNKYRGFPNIHEKRKFLKDGNKII